MRGSSQKDIHFLEKISYFENREKVKDRPLILSEWILVLVKALLAWLMIVFMLSMGLKAMSFSNSMELSMIRMLVLLAGWGLLSKVIWRRIRFLIPFAAVSILAYWTWNHRVVLLSGLTSIGERFGELMAIYFSGNQVPGGWRGSADKTVLLWIAAVLAVYVGIFIFHICRPVIAGLPGVLIIIAVFFVGLTPNLPRLSAFLIVWVLLIVTGKLNRYFGSESILDAFGRYLYIRGIGSVTAPISLLMMVSMTLVLAVSAMLAYNLIRLGYHPDMDDLNKNKEQIARWAQDNADRIGRLLKIEGDGSQNLGGISKGDLAHAGDLYYRGGQIMVVFQEDNTLNNQYIKGFTGDRYYQNIWTDKHDDDFYDTFGSDARTILNLPYYMLSVQGTQTVRIEKMIDSDELGYIVYGAESIGQNWVEDRYVNDAGATVSYHICTAMDSGRLHPESLTDTADSVSLMNPEVGVLAESYTDYVYTHYTEVYWELSRDLKQMCGNRVPDTLQEKLKLVRDTLASRCTYSLTPGRLPEGEDFVRYFLEEHKIGYCMHFATAAVLMLRSMGVPARYVEGYVIPGGAFKRTGGEYAASVYDYQAHAWAEVYVDDFGWIPVEMTPGFYDTRDIGGWGEMQDDFAENEAGNQNADTLPETFRTDESADSESIQDDTEEKDSSESETLETEMLDGAVHGRTGRSARTEKDTEGEAQKNADQQNAVSGGVSETAGLFLKILVLILLIGAAVVSLMALRFKWIRVWRRRRLEQANLSAAAGYQYRIWNRLLRSTGCRIHDKAPLSEQRATCAAWMNPSGLSPDEYYDLLEKLTFERPENHQKKDMQMMIRQYRKMRKVLLERQTPARRFFIRFILGL